MKSTRKIIEKIVYKYLQQNAIKRKAVIIAAFSGGPDSTAMVSVLAGLKSKEFEIICAYYNHGLRNRSNIEHELEIVRRIADKNNLALEIGRAGDGRIAEYAQTHNQSIEEAARNFRYDFLEELRIRYNADYIATGHHSGDNAETMLMRFLQNSGVAGLSGIPKIRNKIIRPLIEVPKELIDDLIKEEAISCSRDETNDEELFLRNRLRHNLIPVIKTIFPEFSNNMSGLSDKVRMYNSFIEAEADKRLCWTETEDGWSINCKILFAEHPLLRIQSVYSRINLIQADKKRIRFAAVENAFRGENAQNGKVLLRAGDFEVLCRNDCILVRRLVNHTKKSYLLTLEPGNGYEIFGQIFQIFEVSDDGPVSDELLVIAAGSPLIIRSFRDGDRIAIKDGSKSIKKLFNEWKVNKDDRLLIPIAEDAGGIAAVMGRHLGYENKTAYGRKITGENQKRVLLSFNTVTETTGE